MKILISGASGLVGRSLVSSLRADGHEILRLVRREAEAAAEDAYLWDPQAGSVDPAALDVDGVIHLAGAPIAEGRWTKARKRAIRESRVQGTETLAKALADGPGRAKVLVCASAIGAYGERGDRVLDEHAGFGNGYLAEVCHAWEKAADAARTAGLRVVHMRLGVVLSPEGGALARMLLPFKMGVGGVLGSGDQWMSWISLDDAVEGFRAGLLDDSLKGPVNLVAPEPVTNREFTKALGRALKRPTVLPMPALAAKLAFGEVADALLLCSTRVVPAELLQSGFRFQHGTVDEALGAQLGRRPLAVPA